MDSAVAPVAYPFNCRRSCVPHSYNSLLNCSHLSTRSIQNKAGTKTHKRTRQEKVTNCFSVPNHSLVVHQLQNIFSDFEIAVLRELLLQIPAPAVIHGSDKERSDEVDQQHRRHSHDLQAQIPHFKTQLKHRHTRQRTNLSPQGRAPLGGSN
jgi:hypothetical protein